MYQRLKNMPAIRRNSRSSGIITVVRISMSTIQLDIIRPYAVPQTAAVVVQRQYKRTSSS